MSLGSTLKGNERTQVSRECQDLDGYWQQKSPDVVHSQGYKGGP